MNEREVLDAIADGMAEIEVHDLRVDKIRMGSVLHDFLRREHIKDSRMWGAQVVKDPTVWGAHAVMSCEPQYRHILDDKDHHVRICRLFNAEACDGCVVQDVMDL